jgi:hypothetical protein
VGAGWKIVSSEPQKTILGPISVPPTVKKYTRRERERNIERERDGQRTRRAAVRGACALLLSARCF